MRSCQKGREGLLKFRNLIHLHSRIRHYNHTSIHTPWLDSHISCRALNAAHERLWRHVRECALIQGNGPCHSSG